MQVNLIQNLSRLFFKKKKKKRNFKSQEMYR